MLVCVGSGSLRVRVAPQIAAWSAAISDVFCITH